MSSRLRRIIDSRAPGAAARYRQVRDEVHFRRLPTYRTAAGFTLTGDPGFDESREGSGERALFLSEVRSSDLLVDIGANVGYFSLLASAKHINVLAIEPDPRNVQLLLQNIARNDLDHRIDVLPVALGDRPGILTLFGGGQGASLVKGWGRINGNYSRLVPVTTLDRLLVGRPDCERLLVKMDVEGYEREVLRGARRTLERTPRPTWIVENTLTANYANVNPHFTEVFEIFRGLGYEARTTEGQLVTEDRIAEWIAARRVDSRDVNFVFRGPRAEG